MQSTRSSSIHSKDNVIDLENELPPNKKFKTQNDLISIESYSKTTTSSSKSNSAKDELKNQKNLEKILFYKETEQFGEFSNFFQLKEPIVYEGNKYATSEHLYQALKFKWEGASTLQLEYAELIRNAKTPNQSKILACQEVSGGYAWRTALNPIIKKYIQLGVEPRQDWEFIRIDVMKKVLRLKFQTDQHCRNLLISTNQRPLAEHTTRDDYWGDGGDGTGENWLGKCLVEVRNEIQIEKKK